jgi:hypothetical protein
MGGHWSLNHLHLHAGGSGEAPNVESSTELPLLDCARSRKNFNVCNHQRF